MKLNDIFGVALIIDCSVMSLLEALIFSEKFNIVFPTSKVVTMTIFYLLCYVIPRLWFFLLGRHFDRFKKSFLFNPRRMINSVPWFICLLLTIMSINITISIIGLSKNDPKTINKLAKYYEVEINRKNIEY